MLGGIVHFHSNSYRTSCKQIEETLIRGRFLRRLEWGVRSESALFAYGSQKGRKAYMG